MIFSFVVPVYNGSEHIANCIYSIVRQNVDFHEYEIIIIDDGSTDDTKDVVLGLGLPFVHYFSQSNRKQGAARNHGIRVARGDYVWLVDADDLIINGAIQVVLGAVGRHAPDVIFYELLREDTRRKNESGEVLNGTERIYSGVEYLAQRMLKLGPTYVYRKRFLQESKVTFAERCYFEDMDYVLSACIESKCVLHIDMNMYRVISRPGSSARVYDLARAKDMAKAVERIYHLAKKHDMNSDLCYYVIMAFNSFWNRYRRLPAKDRRNVQVAVSATGLFTCAIKSNCAKYFIQSFYFMIAYRIMFN